MMLLRQLAHLISRILMIPVHVATFLVRLVVRLAALLVRLIGNIARTALRFLAYVLLLVAAIAFVADATPALSGISAFRATPFSEHIAELAPQSLIAVEKAVSSATYPWVWTYGVNLLIGLPTFLLFGLVGMWAAYAGRRRKQIDVFAN